MVRSHASAPESSQLTDTRRGHLTNNTSRAWAVRKDRPSRSEVVNHLLTIVADVADVGAGGSPGTGMSTLNSSSAQGCLLY